MSYPLSSSSLDVQLIAGLCCEHCSLFPRAPHIRAARFCRRSITWIVKETGFCCSFELFAPRREPLSEARGTNIRHLRPACQAPIVENFSSPSSFLPSGRVAAPFNSEGHQTYRLKSPARKYVIVGTCISQLMLSRESLGRRERSTRMRCQEIAEVWSARPLVKDAAPAALVYPSSIFFRAPFITGAIQGRGSGAPSVSER